MPIKIPIKIPIKKSAKTRRFAIKIRFLMLAAVVATFCLPTQLMQKHTSAAECFDVRVLFARGSGETYLVGQSFQALNAALSNKLQQTPLRYRIEDISYPAVEVGMETADMAWVTFGAAISGGEGFEFGRSVAIGAQTMSNLVNNETCPNTKFVLAGYSQGAMVVHKVLERIDPSRVIYAATFGDPKIYLPEGAGLFPDACRSQNLSDYRVYVPDCHAHVGLLGPTIPYRPDSLVGRVGTWCNKYDIFCSSHFSLFNHASYADDGLFEDASRVIFGKINQAFDLKSSIASAHDTAFLIDSTASMQDLINKYKPEVFRLVKETLDSGGRIALYDYRDLSDPYQPVQHCDFSNCDFETFERELNSITSDGGGDRPESLLSASLNLMRTLKWQVGATKSVVVITDAGFHSPDLDGTSFEKVVQVSKKIDPVNFYVATNISHIFEYEELTTRTDGRIVTDLDGMSALVDYIMGRYDSLPRVDESDEPLVLPTLSLNQIESIDQTSVRVSYVTDAPRTMVLLNDTILGFTDQPEFTLTDLNQAYENTLTLVPFTDKLRGVPVSATLNDGITLDDLILNLRVDDSPTMNNLGYSAAEQISYSTILPKAPDSSKFKLGGWLRLK